MTISDWIQFFILVLALVALSYQILAQVFESRKLDKRNLTKLTIFYFCQETPRSEVEIIENCKNNPELKADEWETKKSVYEMLKDGTLRYRSNNTFKARRNTAKQETKEKSKE